MRNNNLEAVRNQLFQTLQNLSSPENGEVTEMDIEAAKQIAVVSKLILETGKAEMSYNRAIKEGNNTRLTFFEQMPDNSPKLLS